MTLAMQKHLSVGYGPSSHIPMTATALSETLLWEACVDASTDLGHTGIWPFVLEPE
jgi:hypothetical protein